MDLKRLITRLAFKIEPNPAGGFIARTTDPTVPPLEAPTREELQEKIRQNMLSLISEETGAKLPADSKHLQFHIEHKPGGGFTIHSADPNAPVMEVADLKQFEAQFLGKYSQLLGDKFLIPTLAKAFAAKAGAGSMEIVVDTKTSSHTTSGLKAFAFGAPNSFSVSQRASTEMPKFSDASSTPANLSGSIANNPITPESSNIWKIFSFILLLIVAALVYAFLHYR